MTVTRQLCVTYASRPEMIVEVGRVSAAGAILAPAANPAFTIVKGTNGVYTITFVNYYAEFLGLQLTFEGTGTGTALPEPQYSWNAATNAITLNVVSNAPAGIDYAFAFAAYFADSTFP